MTTLTERQMRRLRPGESVVWCGKTHPPTWTFGVIPEMAFGLFWCWLIFGKFMMHWTVADLWCGSESPAIKVGVSLFCLPFLVVGLSCLLSPFRRWLGGCLTVWCITNERILRFGAFRTKSWEKDELFDEATRHDHPDGSVDFLFAEHFVHSRRGVRAARREDILERISADEAPQVAFALRGLKGAKSAWRDSEDSANAERDAPEPPADSAVLLAPPPKHLTVEQDAANPSAGVTLVYRKMSKVVFFLIPFTCFWSGISLFGIYGTQIIQRHFILERSLFGIPFLLGTCVLVGIILFSLFGSRRLTIRGGELRLWSGIGPFGRTRTLRLAREMKVLEGLSAFQVNGRPWPELRLVTPGNPQPFRLLAGAPDNVRTYVAAVLRRELAHAVFT